jgi:hypothetical protein
MTSKTQIIENQEITVRFLNDDKVSVDGFRDIEEKWFNEALYRIKTDLGFNIPVPAFGGVSNERYNFTTLTDEQLRDKFIIN